MTQSINNTPPNSPNGHRYESIPEQRKGLTPIVDLDRRRAETTTRRIRRRGTNQAWAADCVPIRTAEQCIADAMRRWRNWRPKSGPVS